MRWRVALVLTVTFACTKPNPRSCLDGTCTDPAFPFCDLNGEIEGQSDTCIAVACEPDTFAACRGDFAITCNKQGTDFDLVECERGCEDGTGCRLCDPNETACTNGTVATCDTAGTVVEAEPCPLGCFESEPRCREIDPSNGLASFIDLSDLGDLDIQDATITTNTGRVFVGATEVPVTSFLIAAPTNGVPIRVIAANRVRLKNVVIDGTEFDDAPALAIVARSSVTIEGNISVLQLAGGISFGSCVGTPGNTDQRTASNGTTIQQLNTGGGGGGNATNGGIGGSVEPVLGAGQAGVARGNDQLIPLVGGCAGSQGGPGGGGDAGGALQISSRLSIMVDGLVDARGFSGESDPNENGGGGAGGSILLEAPTIILTGSAVLMAKGGPGATGTTIAGVTPPNNTADPAIGMQCVPVDPQCGHGGNGGTVGVLPTNGGQATYTSSPAETFFAGGGGGGAMGRVRINTANGEFTSSSGAVTAASLTTGTINTR